MLLIPRAPDLTQLFSLISSFTVDRAFLRASGSTSRAGGNWGGLEKPEQEWNLQKGVGEGKAESPAPFTGFQVWKVARE